MKINKFEFVDDSNFFRCLGRNGTKEVHLHLFIEMKSTKSPKQ